MYWIPFVAFLISGAVAVAAQDRYFSDLAGRGRAVSPDAEVSQRIIDAPRSLPGIVATEAARRLRALVTRQTDPESERRRLLACASVALAIACFIWTNLGWRQ
jgi:hypothetical protein